MYEYPLPERHGIIKNFGGLSHVALLRMRDDLNLSLRAEHLQKCADYYRNTRQNDPNVDTVCFLDAYITASEKEFKQKAISELTTDSSLIADTFRDLILKRHELYPKASSEVRLTSLTMTGTDWLNKAFGNVNPTQEGLGFHASPASKLTEISHGLEVVSKSSYGNLSAALYKRFRTNRRTPGSLLMIVYPSENMTCEQFEDCVADVIKKSDISKIIEDMRPIACGGIVSALLSMSDGAAVNLSGLPCRSDGGHFCADLCTMYEGGLLLSCSGDSENKLVQAFESHGVLCSCFGTVTKSGVLSIAEGSQLLMGLTYTMLLSLTQEQLIQAEIPEEPGNYIPTEIDSAGICPQFGFISVNSQNSREMSPDGYISSAVTDITDSPFHAAYYAVTAAYLRAIAAGCDTASALLAIATESPCEPCGIYDNGKTISAMLGTYRAQMDLCLRMTDYDSSRTKNHGEKLKFSAQIYTKKPEVNIKNNFTKAGSRVCLLAPREAENGLLEVREVKGLAVYLKDLINQKSILSAKVIGGITLGEALKSMNGAYSIEADADISDKIIPLGVIVETDGQIDADFLGLTDLAHPDDVGIVRHEIKSKLWSDKPTVLIPIIGTPMPGLRDLFNLFNSNGCVCNVLRFENTPEGLGKLSEAMLKSEITVFADNFEATQIILSDERVYFAIEEYKRTGKLILALGQSIFALSETQLLPKVGETSHSIGCHLNACWKLEFVNTPWLAYCPEKMQVNIADSALLIRDRIGIDAQASVTVNGIRYISLFTDESGLVAGAPTGCLAEMILSAIRYFS